MLLTLRGVSRIAASAAGLWLIYGGTYPTEDMTTRIPTNPLHELWVTTLWMVPWMLLFCSGVEDFEKIAGRAWIFGERLTNPILRTIEWRSNVAA
jgi:hypothetical protein